MRFLVGTTKAVQTKIEHKSRNYSMIGNPLYFQGGMVFYEEPLENVTSHIFCMNFMMGYVEATLRDESLQNNFASRLLLTRPLQGCP